MIDALGRLSPSRAQSLALISDTSLQPPFPENLALIRDPLVYHMHFSIFQFQQKKKNSIFFKKKIKFIGIILGNTII